jgi:hypothetical protein
MGATPTPPLTVLWRIGLPVPSIPSHSTCGPVTLDDSTVSQTTPSTILYLVMILQRTTFKLDRSLLAKQYRTKKDLSHSLESTIVVCLLCIAGESSTAKYHRRRCYACGIMTLSVCGRWWELRSIHALMASLCTRLAQTI